ncbi:MAG: tRNA 2-thiouridine(34) synthase MnmA [Lachnospiraceae bacterium]|nr:tRNA 2-thiouridine(34) synthase MnmA [Lachnospiraceae bacterium]
MNDPYETPAANRDEKKALIAMSGGVDSSMAAKLIQSKGFSCFGCTMRLYDDPSELSGTAGAKTCCSLRDVDDARRVCARLGIPHCVVDYREEFKKEVIDRFTLAYERGCTPNPCIDCNNHLKFGTLFRKAEELGCRYIVTGHYARISEEAGIFRLKKALDLTKDQSYFLYGIPKERLSRILFPLGDYTKPGIRELADEAGFVNAAKADSQDICFVPDGDYSKVIREHTGKDYPEGDFVDETGRPLGRHKGIICYTVGQRRGLGISGPEPYYVTGILPEENRVVLGTNESLFRRDLFVGKMNWLTDSIPGSDFTCSVRIRYRHKEQPARVIPVSENGIRVEFEDPQRAITKGQSAVLYDGDYVLGGGIIS